MVKLREFYKDQLSKDYERLWSFLMNGFEVVVFLHNKENEFHPDYVGKAWGAFKDGSPYEIAIISYGTGFFNAWENQTVPKHWKEYFFDFCKEKDLVFIDNGIF